MNSNHLQTALTVSSLVAAGHYVLDELTRKHTSFASFCSLLDAGGNYSPSINVEDRNKAFVTERTILANAYNIAQECRRDARRAYAPGLKPIAASGME